jgi:hypothetical protein
LGLESADLLTERGLGDVLPFRRASEVQLLSDRDEIPDQAQIKLIHSYSLPVKAGLVLDFNLMGTENQQRYEQSEGPSDRFRPKFPL